MIIEYPILGFAPDLPADTPGAIVSSLRVLPTDRGIGSGIAPTVVGGTAFDDSANAGAVLTKIDGTQRVFAGAVTKIYELASGAVTTRGTNYHASTSQRWQFAQLGDVSLAVNKGDRLQACTTGSFANAASNAPKASIVVVVGEPNFQFVMLFDYDDGTNNYTDGAFWANDYTDWTPSIATQCGNVRLLDIGGKFTAAVPFRDGVVAFKQNAMYLGRYVGGAAVWAFSRISNTVGCLGKNAVVEANDTLYFADQYGLWSFDGSYPQPMPGHLHKWWAANAAAGEVVRFTWDKARHRLWVLYAENGAFGRHIVYNMRSQLWTHYDQIGTSTVCYLLSASYGVGQRQFYTFSDAAGLPDGSFTLGAHGATYGTVTFRGARPQFVIGPGDSTTGWLAGTLYYGVSLRNLLNASDAMVFAAPGRLDVMRSARFVAPQVLVSSTAPWEISKMAVDLIVNPRGE